MRICYSGWAGMFLAAFALCTAAGCASKKTVADAEIRKSVKASTLYEALTAHHNNFVWFNGKARVRTITDGFQAGGTIHVRMLQDSLIWARVEKFGFEIGRAYLESDSAFVIDRLNKEFYAESLAEFTAEYRAPFSFADLQQVLAGGILHTPYDAMMARREKTRHVLELNTPLLSTTHWFDKNLRLARTAVVDSEGRSVSLTYSDYRKHGNRHIPYGLFIEIHELESATEILLSFTQIEFDVPQTIKFSIPAHYVKVD